MLRKQIKETLKLEILFNPSSLSDNETSNFKGVAYHKLDVSIFLFHLSIYPCCLKARYSAWHAMYQHGHLSHPFRNQKAYKILSNYAKL